MIKPRRTAAFVVLALAAAVSLASASSASAGSSTVSNACSNSVTANRSQIEVTTSGTDGLTAVEPGGATTLSGITQSAAIPGAIFVAGYNLSLLDAGLNNIPANVRSTIEATNTVEGSQNTNTVGGSPPNGSVVVTTTISDPDGTPSSGDETATPATFSVNYDNLSWTAGTGGVIEYRQESIATAPPTAATNTLLINALVGGALNVQFRCAPGTVTPPDPGTITLIDPAAPFDVTPIGSGPAGVVRNATTGAVIAGATVTLFRSDDPAGPFVQVPNGDPIMSPSNQTNPDTTGASGLFGWDVIAGYYKVQAAAPGCNPGETGVLTIPPPVTELDIGLNCPTAATPAPPATKKKCKKGQKLKKGKCVKKKKKKKKKKK